MPAEALYTVKTGDTLGGIAKAFYGREALWPVLHQANRANLPSRDRLRVGQVLRAPRLAGEEGERGEGR